MRLEVVDRVIKLTKEDMIPWRLSSAYLFCANTGLDGIRVFRAILKTSQDTQSEIFLVEFADGCHALVLNRDVAIYYHDVDQVLAPLVKKCVAWLQKRSLEESLTNGRLYKTPFEDMMIGLEQFEYYQQNSLH